MLGLILDYWHSAAHENWEAVFSWSGLASMRQWRNGTWVFRKPNRVEDANATLDFYARYVRGRID
jgi:hypothetical protein